MAAMEWNAIKSELALKVGETIELHCYARRKVSRHIGVLDGAYNAVFTMLVGTEDGPRRLSFTYADVLTKAITIHHPTPHPPACTLPGETGLPM